MLILWYANKMTALGCAGRHVVGGAGSFRTRPIHVRGVAVRKGIGRGGSADEGGGGEAQSERTRRIAGGFFPFWEQASMPL